MAPTVTTVIEWFHRVFAEISRADRVVSAGIGALPPNPVDRALKGLSLSANHSLLWLAIAALLASRKGAPRRAAMRGVLAIGGASFTANAVLKPLVPRRRPPAAELPADRSLADPPTSSSFPSGHAASAAAFATAVTLEWPKAGLAIAPLAAAVAYSRIHVGVHWTSDVVAGAAVGTGAALATRRWWPVRRVDEARARPHDEAPALPRGAGLLMMANPRSGDREHDPVDELAEALPAATVLRLQDGKDVTDQLADAVAAEAGAVRAIGIAGGDGTVAAAAAVAQRLRLPLAVVPAGTLNHFARDVGVYDLQEVVDATQAGEAVAVDVGVVEVGTGGGGSTRTLHFVNTASLGCYPDLVEQRERWEDRWGKWPAFGAALWTTLRTAKPLHVRLDDKPMMLWTLFVGNGPYHPRGMLPSWRPQLDSGLLDVRYLRADRRFSRARAVLALTFGALQHTRTYSQREQPSLRVELLDGPAMLATDGEVMAEASTFTFRVAGEPIPVYRRDEDNWPDRR